MMVAVSTTSCKDDDDDDTPEVTPTEDGLYIIGAGSAFGSPSLDGAFSIARNEVNNGAYNDGSIDENDRPTLLEAYGVFTAGSGITIRQVSGSTTTDWGFGSDLEVVSGEADGPNVDFQRGTLAVDGTPITVPADGLYHIALDVEAAKLVVIPVSYGLIGGATPNGWGADTPMAESGTSTTSRTWSISDIVMTVDNFKFRSNGGWKVALDADFDLGDGNTGIILNTNLGGTIDNLVAGGADMALSESGIYDVTLTWDARDGFTSEFVRTGDAPSVDYSMTSVALIGAALADHPDGWGDDFMPTLPVTTGAVYEWTFNDVNLVSGAGFKIRTEDDWDTINVGFNEVTVSGDAAAELIANGGDMAIATDGIYDLTFIIDGDDRSLVVSYN